METNNQEQLVKFITELLESQNELIKGLGINSAQMEPSPVDEVWSEIIYSIRKAKTRTSGIIEDEKQKATEPLHAEIDQLNKEMEQKDKTIGDLNSEIARMNDEHKKQIEALNTEHKNSVEKLISENESNLKNLMEKKNAEIAELKEKHDKALKAAAQDKENALNDKNIEMSNLAEKKDKEVENVRNSFAGKAEIADKYSEMTKGYEALLKKVCECKSMEDYCQQNKITNDGSVSSILRFIEFVGAGTKFARDINNAIFRYKKENKSYFPLSEDELELIDEVNSFYRNKPGEQIGEDVLYLPTGFTSEKTSGVKVPFKSGEMKDINGGPLPKLVCEIYTPCYKPQNGAVDAAYVKGISEG